MNNFLEALGGLIFRGIELFLMGAMIVFLIALLITPFMLTFFANGQAQTIGTVFFAIEVLIGIGLFVESCWLREGEKDGNWRNDRKAKI